VYCSRWQADCHRGVIRGLGASTAEEIYFSTSYPNYEMSPIISPSGNLFALAEPDGVHILNKTTGELVGPLKLEENQISRLLNSI